MSRIDALTRIATLWHSDESPGRLWRRRRWVALGGFRNATRAASVAEVAVEVEEARGGARPGELAGGELAGVAAEAGETVGAERVGDAQ